MVMRRPSCFLHREYFSPKMWQKECPCGCKVLRLPSVPAQSWGGLGTGDWGLGTGAWGLGAEVVGSRCKESSRSSHFISFHFAFIIFLNFYLFCSFEADVN